jgi:hypothetical protein
MRFLPDTGADDDHLCLSPPQTLARLPPAVRFHASHSNDCWRFDLSPSDLKQVPAPVWVREDRGHPLLMLYSVVDDRSGVAYQEYHCVYGEDVEAALRFLFASMAPKAAEDVSFQGIWHRRWGG